VEAGFTAEIDDIFYLRRDEIPEALFDMSSGWAVGNPSREVWNLPVQPERK
jgi:pyruvate,water dikinase